MDLNTYIFKYQIRVQTIAAAVGVSIQEMSRIRHRQKSPRLSVAFRLHDFSGGQIELRELLCYQEMSLEDRKKALAEEELAEEKKKEFALLSKNDHADLVDIRTDQEIPLGGKSIV